MDTYLRSHSVTEDSIDQGFRNRYQLLKDTDGAKNLLFEELLYTLEKLHEEHRQMAFDKEREMYFNRDFQKRSKESEAELRKLRSLMERNPFVLILLDGDGMIFQDHLLQKAEQGGRDAAGLLWTAVREYLARELPELSSDCKIVARIYANTKGLAETCYKAGIVDRPLKVEEFARGFTRSKHLFDFIDVGSGKDRADEKLTEIFKLHLSDCHCRQILFGCSHDNGYARLLEEFATHPESASRICLLEGYPFEREISVLKPHFKSTKFESIFRSIKINSQPQSAISASPPKPHPASLPPFIPSFTHQATSVNPTPQSWASAVTTPPSLVASPPPTPQPVLPATQAIPRNRKGQRVDPEIKYDRYDIKRVKAMKMCNQHYLRGDCGYGYDCTHDHEYKPTASELATLRYIARMAPCRMGTDCDDPKCIYGHRCPAGNPCAFGDSCRFPEEMHNLDTVVVKSIKIGY